MTGQTGQVKPLTRQTVHASRASVSGRMDVYYAQKIAKYVQNPEVDTRIRPNFEARRKHTSKINVLA